MFAHGSCGQGFLVPLNQDFPVWRVRLQELVRELSLLHTLFVRLERQKPLSHPASIRELVPEFNRRVVVADRFILEGGSVSRVLNLHQRCVDEELVLGLGGVTSFLGLSFFSDHFLGVVGLQLKPCPHLLHAHLTVTPLLQGHLLQQLGH